jgi:nitrogen regulatory protein PII
MKKPTLKQKVQKYEELLHLIQLNAEVAMNAENVKKLINNVCNWSYAHRFGNGKLSEAEQQRIINISFEKLTDIQ